MDANETRYHLLLGYDDWANCRDADRQLLRDSWLASPVEHNATGLAWNFEQSALTLQPRLFQFTASRFERPLSIDQRRGAGRDRYGNWYWIGDSGGANGVEIRVNSSGTGRGAQGRGAHFWSPGDGATCDDSPRYGDFHAITPPPPTPVLALSGLAVTVDHYLVVGVLQPKGLLIFDLHAGGPPRQVLWPVDVDFVPFDFAPRPHGGVWMLDRINRRYWALDRKLNVVRLDQAPASIAPDPFQPIDQSSIRQTVSRPFPEAITLAASSPLNAIDPIAIEALTDDTVLILDNTPSQPYSLIYHYRFAEQLSSPASTDAVLEVVEEQYKSEFRLRGYDFAFTPKTTEDDPALLGRVTIVAFDGNQSYAFDLFEHDRILELHALPNYLPMRLFGGKALVAADGRPYYDFGENWLPLVEQKRPTYEPVATLYTWEFDGREPDCVWHRLLLDACIPPDTRVEVRSRAANTLNDLKRSDWFTEPDVYLRGTGSELPYVRRATNRDTGTWETLFQRAQGRYLQLEITLSGNGRSTPRLRALRLYYPRFSYLTHYLPGVYREDDQSASFLDRFLANLEGTFTALEDQIAAVQMLFDVRSAPAETLDWLASWFGLALDPDWDDVRRRLFIKYAMLFFQYRGTVRGLILALHLALDTCIDEVIFLNPIESGSPRARYRIVEQYRTRSTPPVVLGDPTDFAGLRVVTDSERWQPQDGVDRLNERYSTALGLDPIEPYPISDPNNARSAAWQKFSRQTLGFVPSATTDDQSVWVDYLRRRYDTLTALNNAYTLIGAQRYATFEAVLLPDQLPTGDQLLIDWFQFESTALAMRRTAHQFTVLLPTPSQLSADEHQRRRELAARVIALEKPAHTIFDVKFFWAMFRVGEARLGEDTLIDLGSRSPQLMPPIVLDQTYLLDSYLSTGHPYNVTERRILGRDQL